MKSLLTRKWKDRFDDKTHNEQGASVQATAGIAQSRAPLRIVDMPRPITK